MKRLLCLIFALMFGATAIAKEAQPIEDPQMEQRMKTLTEQLRCLVCRNETLADSRAELAEDLRKEIREQIRAGKSDKEIITFLTDRYGQYILYRPRVTPATYLLWFGPFVLLILGLVILFRYIRSRRDSIDERPLSNEERQRAAKLLTVESGKETA